MSQPQRRSLPAGTGSLYGGKRRARGNATVATFHTIQFQHSYMADIQQAAKQQGLTHLDLVGVQMDTGEWTHVLRWLVSHPTVNSLDLHGVTFSSKRLEQLLDLVRTNPKIKEVLLDRPEYDSVIQPAVKENVAQADEAKATEHITLMRQRQSKNRQEHADSLAVLQKMELRSRRSVGAQWSEWHSSARQEIAASLGKASQAEKRREELDQFFTRLQKVVDYSCNQRYLKYTTDFVVPFFAWRQDQEKIGRSAFEAVEEVARVALRKLYFDSWESHRAQLNRRQKKEAAARSAVAEEQADERRIISAREESCWEAIVSAKTGIEQRDKEVTELIESRLAEDQKRKDARMSDLEGRRSYRREKIAKELHRLSNIHNNDRDRLFRAEMVSRMRLVNEEPQYFSVVQDLWKALAALGAARSRCGDAARAKMSVFTEPVVFTATRSQVGDAPEVKLHYPSQNKGQVVAENVSMRVDLPSSWSERVVAAIQEANASLSWLRKVQSSTEPKEQTCLAALEALNAKFGLDIHFHKHLHPALENDHLSQLSEIQYDLAELEERKLGLAGGSEVHVGCMNPPSEDYTCSFSLLNVPEYHSLRQLLVDHVVPNPNSSTFVLRNHALYDLEDISRLMSIIRVQASLVPGCPLPFVQEVQVGIDLRFCNLRDINGEIVTETSPYSLTTKVKTQILVAKALITLPKAPLTWCIGHEDLRVFEGLRVDVPPGISGEGSILATQHEANAIFDGAEVTVRFLQGASEYDSLLCGPSTSVLDTATLPKRKDQSPPSTRSVVVRYDDMEVGILKTGKLDSLENLRKNMGYNFVHSCPEIVVRFEGKFATVRRIERWLRELSFYNRGLCPTPGKREIVLDLSYGSASCECKVVVNVVAEDIPTRLHVPKKELHYWVPSNGDVVEEFMGGVTESVVNIFPDSHLVDPSSSFFVGGHIRASISGYKLGDRLWLREGNGIVIKNAEEQSRSEIQDESSLSHNSSRPEKPPKIATRATSPRSTSSNNPKDTLSPKSGTPLERRASSTALRSAPFVSQPSLDPTPGSPEGDGRNSPSTLPTVEIASRFLGKQSVYYNGEEIGELKAVLPMFYVGGDERRRCFRTKRKVNSKKKDDDALPETVFPPHESLAENGPQELVLQFARTGACSVDACNTVLQNLAFSSTCLHPKTGDRSFSLEMVIGSQDVGTGRKGLRSRVAGGTLSSPATTTSGVEGGNLADAKTTVLIDEVVVHVQPPLLRVLHRHTTVKYLEGCGWRLFPSMSCQIPEGVPEPELNGALLRFSVIENFLVGDYLWLRSDELIIQGVQSESVFLEAPTAQGPVTLSPGKSVGAATQPPVKMASEDEQDKQATTLVDATQRGNVIYRSAKIFHKADGSELAELTLDDDTGILEIRFAPLRPGRDPLTRSTVNLFVKCLAFYTNHTLEKAPSRGLKVCLTDVQGRTSQVFFKLWVRTEDDPSEIVLPASRVVYRHGLTFIPGTMADLPIAPICDASVSDTDTEYFDGGHLVCQFSGGACKGDQLYFMSIESQVLQYRHINAAPNLLLRLDGMKLLLEETGEHIATMTQYVTPDLKDVHHIRFQFHKIEGRLKKSLVPITLVTHILNCVCYRSLLSDRVKSGIRTINLAVSDGTNPAVGKAQLQLEVQPPLIQLTAGATRVEVFYFIGAPGTVLGQKILLSLGKEETWTGGYLDFKIQEPWSPLEALTFNPTAFVGTAFNVKEFKPENEKTLFGPDMIFLRDQAIGENMLVEGGQLLQDQHGGTIGRIVCKPHQITVYFTQTSRFGGKHLDILLKSVTYEHKDVNAAAQKAQRVVSVRAAEGVRLGGANQVDVVVKIGMKAK